MIMAFPDSRVRVTASHSSLLATGSIPVDGSSRKMTGGPPIRAMPALSFRLLPPLQTLTILTYTCLTKKKPRIIQTSAVCVAPRNSDRLTCSCGPVCQHEAPTAATSGRSPRSLTHTSLVSLGAWHTYSAFPFPSCGPTQHQTEGSTQCAVAPASQRLMSSFKFPFESPAAV